MARSSALRREEAVPAPTPITINAKDVPNPKDASIANDGSVTFNAAKACWLYFSPVGVFGDSQGILKLNVGSNGPYSSEEPDVTVSYCVTDPNTSCNPIAAKASSTLRGSPDDGGNTIKVG
jgi:hypothetical protein